MTVHLPDQPHQLARKPEEQVVVRQGKIVVCANGRDVVQALVDYAYSCQLNVTVDPATEIVIYRLKGMTGAELMTHVMAAYSIVAPAVLSDIIHHAQRVALPGGNGS
jgi:hypothetical protein